MSSAADLFAAAPRRDTLAPGVDLFRAHLTHAAQVALLDDMADVLRAAPALRPRMRNGTPFVNALSNCGPLGWWSDEAGYRYVETHPVTGAPWPAMPQRLLDHVQGLIAELGLPPYAPDACLVNLYAADGRMGLHRDFDEASLDEPIVSFSFGAEADFLLGGLVRKGSPQVIRLHSGDVLVMHGAGRRRYHGVRRVRPGTAPFAHAAIPDGGRLNLTLRRAR